MIYLFILPHIVLSASRSFSELTAQLPPPIDIPVQGINRIPRNIFYPSGIISLPSKSRPILPIGSLNLTSPGQLVRDEIEKIPIEKRSMLLRLFRDQSWKVYLSIRANLPAEQDDDVNYITYIRSTMSIDQGVLRLLNRFATRTLRQDERYIDSAAKIVEHFQTRYPDGRFDHLTPEYIHDWYEEGMNSGHIYVPTNTLEDRARIERDDTSCYGVAAFALNVDKSQWRRLIKMRLHRLETTGYDLFS